MTDRAPPESPQAWLQRARSDLALGRAALGTPDVFLEDACFHAQQCAEKALTQRHSSSPVISWSSIIRLRRNAAQHLDEPFRPHDFRQSEQRVRQRFLPQPGRAQPELRQHR